MPTNIEWTDETWNPLRGCTRVSPGCGGPGDQGGCYAEKIAARFSDPGQPFHGLAVRTSKGGRWTGKVALAEHLLTLPLKWRRPRRVFVNSMSDLFHEDVPDEWIDRVFAVMALAPQHTFQVLTKRAQRMRDYLSAAPWGCIEEAAAALRPGFAVPANVPPLPNVWLGVSVEDQVRADERVPHLLATPAAVRFLSCEPLLGPVDLNRFMPAVHHHPDNQDRSSPAMLAVIKAARDRLGGGLDWVIAGGESGPGARPMHPDWARSLRDQCAAAGVPFFFKQWGEWGPIGRLHDDAGDTDETIAAETAMMEAMQTLPDESDWIDPRRLQLVDSGMFNWANECAQPPSEALVIKRVGKKAAGRLLDGVTHDGMPG